MVHGSQTIVHDHFSSASIFIFYFFSKIIISFVFIKLINSFFFFKLTTLSRYTYAPDDNFFIRSYELLESNRRFEKLNRLYESSSSIALLVRIKNFIAYSS